MFWVVVELLQNCGMDRKELQLELEIQGGIYYKDQRGCKDYAGWEEGNLGE